MDHATRFTFHGLRVHPGPHRLRGIKKEITPSEHVRFIGETNDSHCDRFWAKALRQEATRHTCEVGAEVGW